MEFDHDAARAKRASLEQYAARPSASAPVLDSLSAKALLDAFAQITPPEKPEFVIELIDINSLHGRPRARSHKPGNLFLNWRRLVEFIPDVTLAAAGAASMPTWTIPLVALYVWNKLWSGIAVEFTDAEATTILALWKNCNDENKISEEDGFLRTNALRESLRLPQLTRSDYVQAVDRLVKIECVELNDGVIRLREWIRVSYG